MSAAGVLGWAAVVAVCWGAGPAVGHSSDAPSSVLAKARALISEGKAEQAAALLEERLREGEKSPALRVNLGYVYEVLGRAEDAVVQYGEVLRVAPANTYARERLRRIFFSDRFPGRLRVSQLGLLPVPFARFRVKRPDGKVATGAVTVAELFPAGMRKTGKPVALTVPPGVEAGEECRFNRVVYVFVGGPGSEEVRLRAEVNYPSALLSLEARDYRALAGSLARTLARFEAYMDCIIPSDSPPKRLSVWLCEGGPAGGEEFEGGIYLYQVGRLRPGEEWQRELAHELGHARLPVLGGYREPEESLAGAFGEAWLMASLAAEAQEATRSRWDGERCRRWIDGLWPEGAVNVGAVLQSSVFKPLALWQSQGPYAADPSSAEAGRRAVGMLLWIHAAHGPRALANVLGGELGTLPVLAARYVNWLRGTGQRISLSALACCGAVGAEEKLLPMGAYVATASVERPWRTVCYLPRGSWTVRAGGESLVARWRPLGEQSPAARWLPAVASEGCWGVLELAGAEGNAAKFSAVQLIPAPQT